MTKFTECRHDGESIVSLMEQHGYSEDDMLLCKLCQKEEIERLTVALELATEQAALDKDVIEQYQLQLYKKDKCIE